MKSDLKVCEFTGKKYKGMKTVKCKCRCHEKGSKMVHMAACCDQDGNTEVRNYIE